MQARARSANVRLKLLEKPTAENHLLVEFGDVRAFLTAD